MSDLHVSGMDIAPNVVKTIVAMAVNDVEGVSSLVTDAPSGIRRFLPGGKATTQGVEVDVDEDDKLHIAMHVEVKSGYVLPDVATELRRAVADAVAMQMGIDVGSVDVYIDGIRFGK